MIPGVGQFERTWNALIGMFEVLKNSFFKLTKMFIVYIIIYNIVTKGDNSLFLSSCPSQKLRAIFI